MRTIWMDCVCGGGASVTVREETHAVTTCGCGRLLVWRAPGPATLSLAVADDVRTGDILT